ncbi:MAG: SAM-dependent methyltransferase [Cyclobacteriaceae bacterium]|nr:SAM-dependent methyltransferase [Cyclobacteriaceae bacterium]
MSALRGKLFLFPVVIAEDTEKAVIPPHVIECIKNTQYFLCENIRTARRFISKLKVHSSIESLHFEILDKDTSIETLPKLFVRLLQGNNIGVLSESGCPGVADPGALAVAYAHENGFTVVPLVGPSSILLALMASGLNGQQFAFHGYLPVHASEAGTAIKMLERESKEKNQTQIFIETPYRNNALLSHLVKTLQPDTRLCVAINLTAPGEKIICQSVRKWKQSSISLEKVPAVFLFLAGS